jgi:2-phosphosulfolactate phosphatase
LKVHISWTPAETEDFTGKSVVVIDVLRASTTIVTALANGSKAVIPFADPEEAREASGRYPVSARLLCGERNGLRIEGFDLGNSPSEYSEARVKGKTLLYASTNGSPMIQRARAGRVSVAGFVNISAVVNRLDSGADCRIACSGREGGFSIEDAVCAGMIADRLASRGAELDDSGRAGMALYGFFAGRLDEMIRGSDHGRYLTRLGMGNDLDDAIRVDHLNVVPLLQDGELVADDLPGQNSPQSPFEKGGGDGMKIFHTSAKQV